MPRFIHGERVLKELLDRVDAVDAIVTFSTGGGVNRTVALLWRDAQGDMDMVTQFDHMDEGEAAEAVRRIQAAQRSKQRTAVCRLVPYQRLVCWEIPRDSERNATRSNPFSWI